jgi:hypothetical protein
MINWLSVYAGIKYAVTIAIVYITIIIKTLVHTNLWYVSFSSCDSHHWDSLIAQSLFTAIT